MELPIVMETGFKQIRNTKEEKNYGSFGQAAESQFRIQNYLRKHYNGQMPVIGRAVMVPICIHS